MMLSGKNPIGRSYKCPLCLNEMLQRSVAPVPGRKYLHHDFVSACFPADPDVSSLLDKVWALWVPRIKQLWVLGVYLA